MMILDALNIFILTEIVGKGETTTWKMAKKFPWPDKPSDISPFGISLSNLEKFYCKKTMLIVKRIKSMEKEGLIKTYKEKGKNIYEIVKFPKERVKIVSHLFPYRKDKTKSLMILQDNSKWLIREL